ncbi:SDR family oxidoreductase [Actinophytocola sp.]|uniref:SDR family NAD(P)-dependent oxidoreductase n=1 Tax=Actinophytocola sp. TaxID=1872138 RepID=UPI002ED9D8D2
MTPHPWSLAGRTVLLTGAAGAVGKAAAAAFTEAGAKVVGVDRNKDALVSLIATGALADGLAGDLTDAEFVAQIVADQPEVDVLVNNVGAGTSLILADTTDDVLDHMVEINLRTAFRLCRAYAPGMAERRRGKVINLSSVLGMHPVPTVAAYAAAKASLIGFTKSIALEYAGRGVQCNVLAPGYLAGPKNAEYFDSDVGQQFVKRFMPTGRVGPEDALNGPLLFLASGMSDHMTGQVLVVDGGYSIW